MTSTTAMVVKLVHGGQSLNLMSGRYKVADSFVPPSTQIEPLIAQGTSGNRLAGGTKIGEHARNRAWGFPVDVVNCGSGAEAQRAVTDLNNFLSLAGDLDMPVYLYFKPQSDISLDPLWGQSCYLYEIVQGQADMPPLYAVGDLRSSHIPAVPVSLTIKPYAQGRPQLVAQATGGILSDVWGTPDGLERGLIVPPGTASGGNKMTNPVLGHPTWNNNWTAAANIIATQNTDPNFLLPQTQNSAFIEAIAASSNTFTQSINVGSTSTHTLMALVMRPDGAAITSADCDLFYGSAKTTTYRALGDALYLLTCSMAGINAGTATGLRVKSGMSVYLLAAHLELGTPEHMGWGDLLGWTWSGTAHASASTRTAATCKVAIDDTVIRAGQGSVTLTWIPPLDSTAYAAANYIIWDARDGSHNALLFYFDGTNDFIGFGNTSALTAVPIVFSAGDVLVFHVTWGPTGGAIIYKNGVSIGNTTYTPIALGANLFIGSDYLAGSQAGGTFVNFRSYGHEMAATEVANDYGNTSKVSGATADVCQRVGAIPWFYTSAGDGVLNTVDGAVSTVVKYNWAVAGGIPGSAAAQVELKLTHSGFSGAIGDIYLARSLWPYFYHGASKQPYYAEQGGTADSGNSSGDAYNTQSVDSTTAKTWVGTFDNYGYLLSQGREFYMFARLKDAGANLTIKANLRIQNSGSATATTDSVSVAADTNMRLFNTKPLVAPRIRRVFIDDTTTLAAQFELSALRSTGGGSNVSVDFIALMPRPLTNISYHGSSSNTVLRVAGRLAYLGSLVSDTPSNTFEDFADLNGDVFTLEPGGYNFVQNLLADPSAIMDVTATLTFNAVRVTPRYALV